VFKITNLLIVLREILKINEIMFDINKVLIEKKIVKYLVDVEFIYIVSLFLHCLSMFARQRVSANDLRADEGRETKALNCKPITNL